MTWAKVWREREVDVDAWDYKPRMMQYKGEDTEFFKVGHLAKALGKSVETIRLWTRLGIIPDASFRLKKSDGKGPRLWTREQVEAIKRIADEEGVLVNRRIGKTPEEYAEFTRRVKQWFQDNK